eukprot:1194839-Prorocentrum_minimum.AAC.3
MDVLMAMENLAPENVNVPAKAKASKPAASKAPKGDNVLKASNGQQKVQKDGRRVEEIYQKKSQLEHILLRPDTYVGSVEKQTAQTWVQEGDGVALKTISYVPALFKIFDEIIVNAIDNKVRDSSMSTLKVDINREKGVISVMNDGAGIPVEMHSEEKVYIPELIFGHLLTSSNYDDSEKKQSFALNTQYHALPHPYMWFANEQVVGGRNGYGAKLANVFSTEFVVETCDGHRQKRYRQVFNDNMSKIGKPAIKDCKESENWTKITFTPDLQKFGMEELEEDICSLLRKRVYDAAGVLGKGCKVRGVPMPWLCGRTAYVYVYTAWHSAFHLNLGTVQSAKPSMEVQPEGRLTKVFLDGTRLPIKDFSNYVDLFLKDKTEPVKIYEKVSALSNHVYQSCAMRDSRCIFPCAAGLVSGAPTR